MADNVFTDLFPDVFKALDVVSNEPAGILGAVSHDANVERVAKDQVIRSFVAPAASLTDFTPGQAIPDSGNHTIGNVTMTISKERLYQIRYTGKDQKQLNSSYGWKSVFQDQIEQGLRSFRNEMASDLTGLYAKASRAVDPSGTTLFDGADYNDVANVRKILVDNGAPVSDLQLIVNTNAGAALRGNAQYAGANTAGREDIVRRGILLDVHNMKIAEDANIVTKTVGDATSATTDNAGYAVGATVLTLASAGTNSILAGDHITLAGDTNEYVVASGDADVSDGGTITLAAPGLRQAIPASTTAITVEADTQMNMAFSRNAIHLATRLIDMPEGGDVAVDSTVIRDPHSGMAYELRRYNEFGQVSFFLAAAWGFEMIKPEHCALLVD